MRLLIKTLHTTISEFEKSYLRRKILKYEKILPSSAMLECTFEEKTGPQRSGNKIVHLLARAAGFRKPLFVKSEAVPDFRTALDIAEERFNRRLEKLLEIQKYGTRRKYYWIRAKGLPRVLWRKVRWRGKSRD